MRAERFVAAAIVVLALALAIAWVFRVPFFEEPDENTHADYAFTLFTLHAPFRAQDGVPATDVHPLVRYLEDRSNFRTVRYDPDGRVKAGYGSAAFYRSVDAGAPHVPADFLQHDGARVPWVARHYVYLYYALDALAIGVAALVSGGSAVAEFFGARMFNVVLLGASLALTYLTLRELGLRRWLRLALLAAIGWFPLTTWVSAYVQPDNLAFTAVALVFYLSVRLRREPDALRAALWLGLGLGLLAMTKSQYFIAVALPAIADRTMRSAPQLRSAPQWCRYAALVSVPTIVLVLSSLLLEAGEVSSVAQTVSENGNPLAVAAHHSLGGLLSYIGHTIGTNALRTFSWGLPFVSYWGMISWTGRQFDFGGPGATSAIYTIISVFSLVILTLVAHRTCLVWIRLARVLARSPRRFLRLVFSDVILNAYALFLAVMAVIWLTTGLGTQGRYWLPFVLPATLCATRYALPHVARTWRLRRAFAAAMTCLLLLYSVLGSVAALGALEDRFYIPPRTLNNFEYYAHITSVGFYEVYGPHGEPRLRPNAPLAIGGWAIDSRAGAPALGVAVVIDDRRSIRAQVGRPRPDVIVQLHDDALLDSGFLVRLPRGLPPGPHSFRLEVYERDRRAPHPARGAFEIKVEPPRRRVP